MPTLAIAVEGHASAGGDPQGPQGVLRNAWINRTVFLRHRPAVDKLGWSFRIGSLNRQQADFSIDPRPATPFSRC